MNLLGIIGKIFKPAMEAIDEVHTSTEEKLQKKVELMALYSGFLSEGLQYEQSQLEAKTRIIEAEAKSESFLTSNWRPITMLTFLVMTVAYWFGLTPDGVSQEIVAEVFTLIQIGLGGYVVGRSFEKVVPAAVKAFKEKEQT